MSNFLFENSNTMFSFLFFHTDIISITPVIVSVDSFLSFFFIPLGLISTIIERRLINYIFFNTQFSCTLCTHCSLIIIIIFVFNIERPSYLFLKTKKKSRKTNINDFTFVCTYIYIFTIPIYIVRRRKKS